MSDLSYHTMPPVEAGGQHSRGLCFAMQRVLVLHIFCYAISAAALIGAVLYIIFGEHTGLGILGVLIAAVLSRVLILNVVHGKS